MSFSANHRSCATIAAVIMLAATGATRARADEIAVPAAPDRRTEVTILPLFGGDTDIGIGGGFLGAIARIDKEYKPYFWRVESVGIITFKPAPGGGVEVPYQEYFFKITLPHLVPRRVRLELRPSFNLLSTVKYHGLGNDSKVDPREAVSPRDYEFKRISPGMKASARLPVRDALSLVVGAGYAQHWLEVPSTGKLAEDMRSGSDTVRSMLGDDGPHGVLQFEYGVVFDHRDNELATKRGMFHQGTLHLSPGGRGLFLPYQFGLANITTRFYLPLFTPRVVLAVRGVLDLLFGQPPFYELARYEDGNAIGGTSGVRGVPAQRYYGKAKAFGNVEIRTEIVEFRLWNARHVAGVVGFFDGGRVWADYAPHPELDGKGLGLKYGVGGGLRLQRGDSFLLRADVAWSPDARPVAAYFGAGHMF